MNHDFHGVVEFVERTRHSVVFDQRDAADADIAIDHGKRDWLQALFLAPSVDAEPGFNLEDRAVPSALQECPVRREEVSFPEIEPDSFMRAGIDIAKIAFAVGPDHAARNRSTLAGLVDP